MIDHIQHTIEELKQKVQNNVIVITKNQDAIKQILKHSGTDDYAGQYDVYNSKNRELLTQNNDLINVQLTLVNFIEKYKETAILKPEVPIVDIYSVTDAQEVFALTIKGIIEFNNEHPHFNNVVFIDKLIVYYESNEDYERCLELKKQKEGSA